MGKNTPLGERSLLDMFLQDCTICLYVTNTRVNLRVIVMNRYSRLTTRYSLVSYSGHLFFRKYNQDKPCWQVGKEITPLIDGVVERGIWKLYLKLTGDVITLDNSSLQLRKYITTSATLGRVTTAHNTSHDKIKTD